MAELTRVADFDQVILDAWSAHEVLRRVGFEADDIYFVISRSVELGGAQGIYIRLERDGKELNYFCGALPHDPKETEVRWKRFVELFNNDMLDSDELNRFFRNSRAYRSLDELAGALLRKGISIPGR